MIATAPLWPGVDAYISSVQYKTSVLFPIYLVDPLTEGNDKLFVYR